MIFWFRLLGRKFSFLLVFIVGCIRIRCCICDLFSVLIVLVMVRKVLLVFVGLMLKLMLCVVIWCR